MQSMIFIFLKNLKVLAFIYFNLSQTQKLAWAKVSHKSAGAVFANALKK